MKTGPLSGEGGLVEDVRISWSLLLDKSRQRQLHVQRHQAVNKGFPLLPKDKWEVGGCGREWAGEVAVTGSGKGSRGLWLLYFTL